MSRQKFYTETGEELLEAIAALRVGERLEVPPHAYVKKTGRGEYVLHDRSNKYRNRWGNLKQIVEDAEHYAEFGALPRPSGGHW